MQTYFLLKYWRTEGIVEVQGEEYDPNKKWFRVNFSVGYEQAMQRKDLALTEDEAIKQVAKLKGQAIQVAKNTIKKLRSYEVPIQRLKKE